MMRGTFLLGNCSVCINAATMALIDAGIPMKDYVCASTAGYIQDTPMLGMVYIVVCCVCVCQCK